MNIPPVSLTTVAVTPLNFMVGHYDVIDFVMLSNGKLVLCKTRNDKICTFNTSAISPSVLRSQILFVFEIVSVCWHQRYRRGFVVSDRLCSTAAAAASSHWVERWRIASIEGEGGRIAEVVTCLCINVHMYKSSKNKSNSVKKLLNISSTKSGFKLT